MGLRLKFNLVLLVMFSLGLGVSAYVSYELLQRNARDEVQRSAGRYFDTYRSAIVIVGDYKQIKDQIAPFGDVRVVK